MYRILLLALLAALAQAQSIAEGLASTLARERLLALRTLQAQPDPATEPLLRKALQHPDPLTRGMAVAALCRVAPQAGRRVATAACGDREARIRALAVEALALLDGIKALSAVHRGLSDAEATVRLSAAQALHRLTGDPALKPGVAATAAARLVADPDLAVRHAGIALAATLPGEEGRAALLAACRASDEDTASEAGAALASKPYAASAARTLLGLVRSGTPDQRLRICAALTALAHPSAFAAVTELASAGNGLPDLRCAGLELLAACADGLDATQRSTGERLAINLLADDDWAVRASAAMALARLGSGLAMPALIARLGATRDPDGLALQQALVTLSGADGIEQAKDWLAWWQRNQNGFNPRPAPPPADSSEVAFYAVHDTAERVLFVIDTSASMSGRDQGTTLLQTARSELDRCVLHLAPGTRFNVIFFNEEQRQWSAGLRRATWRAKRDFTATTAALRPHGNTGTYAALRLAFAQPGLDAIYLLSDGVPSVGIIDPTLIAQEVEVWRLVQHRPPRIHTIALLNRSAEGFLTLLARTCGGTFRRVE